MDSKLLFPTLASRDEPVTQRLHLKLCLLKLPSEGRTLVDNGMRLEGRSRSNRGEDEARYQSGAASDRWRSSITLIAVKRRPWFFLAV